MAKESPAKLKSVTVKLDTPLLKVQGTWEADESEQRAAWELYVELITRISVQKLKADEEILREALTSLHSIFSETRRILRSYGPDIARPKGKGKLSFGYLAVSVLNKALRPVLLAYENTRPNETSSPDYEKKWDKNKELRKVLEELRQTLQQYAQLLADVAGIPNIDV